MVMSVYLATYDQYVRSTYISKNGIDYQQVIYEYDVDLLIKVTWDRPYSEILMPNPEKKLSNSKLKLIVKSEHSIFNSDVAFYSSTF